MTGKVALVTGANQGIGFEIARKLAQSGATVLLGARSASTGEKAAATLADEGLDVRYVELDICREFDIATLKETIEGAFGALDILVNNAGIVDERDGWPSVADPAGVERIWRTNFLGTLAVTQAMLPLLRKSAAGRIVNVSSGLGSLARSGDRSLPTSGTKLLGYSASKAALNMLTVQLAYELHDTKIKVNSAAPGYTATALNAFQGLQTVEEGAIEATRLALLPDDGPSGTFSDRFGPTPW
jgi:NAD(P)-dependent dehydrogenase (short-subunit alcohol dehydrogenase family)